MTKSRGLREHHGKHQTKAYGVWAAMKSRCNNPNNPAYADYGARGIKVCAAWEKFSVFHKDMGDPPDGYTIERADNSLGYSPTNCLWATRKAQSINKRGNVLLTMDGETHPLSVWAERYGLKYATVHQRVTKYGWTPEASVKTPIVTHRLGIPRGESVHSWRGGGA